MKKLKIVTIGGGSSYTPELVEGFIKRYAELPVTELWLVDIEEGREKLDIVGRLAQRMVEAAGLPLKVILSLDRKEALKDADFVTTQLRVGQLSARILDERIPLTHGILGQETNGAGGMFKALRTIPVIMEIVEDMKVLCPDAWLINFTNPAGMVTEAVQRYGNFSKVVGLCNVPVGMKKSMAKQLKAQEEDIAMEIVGLNHHFFMTDVFEKGQSRMKEILEGYEKLTPEDEVSMKNIMTIPWTKELVRALAAIPCPYLSYYFYPQEQLQHQLELFATHSVRAEFVKGVEDELFALYAQEELHEKPKQLEQRGGAHYSDAACSLITSIYNDKGDIQYVNTRNAGALTDFPEDTIIEVAAKITKDGPVPIPVGAIPEALKGTIHTIKSFERMTVEAAVTGNRDLAIAALTLNPLVPSGALAVQVFDELYEAHKAYLPQFKGESHA
ncbi:6-phospho-beta-glucosidase [Proteiniclasticum sp. BAD-10]|uniref:6-phospho-beta-glucosidase n=1 Tax=Proteiniclasticum sediminis TaxID=2804028 RepID=A0A941HP88_9CLOT|nr:6-phospho-beta-glucosidase [Proteiniclasticum sediminis]MBR0575069.1 6-phospho-beta-glucosidase [Proteiniclasticum sediminis]